ncbi:MAG: DNA mismatch repair protein MutS, partial [Eudoraea sp.]|nr:DNA mismatch repair protein MutS [Eudoraea sp.]
MEQHLQFYHNQIELYSRELSIVGRQLFASSMFRLGIFLTAVLMIYLFYGQTRVVFGVVILTFALFLYLVSRHTDLQYKRDKLMALIGINETELKVYKRQFQNLPDGKEFLDASHEYSQDLDLFGKGSFYQYSNRTSLQQGSELYASILTANNTKAILKKQQAVKELAGLAEWRQDFSAIANMVKTETPYSRIIKWMEEYHSFTSEFLKYLPWIFSVLSAAVIFGYFLGWISLWLLVSWFFVGLGITGRYLKRIGKLASDCAKIQSTFQQYQVLLHKLEEIDFAAELLKDKRALIIQEQVTASKRMRRFSRLLNGLDQRNNIIIGILGNAFMLRDIQICYAIEQWIKINGKMVASWFSAIAFFDAYNTMGNFAFNHPGYNFPELQKGPQILKVTAATHPMLDPEKGVINDFDIR